MNASKKPVSAKYKKLNAKKTKKISTKHTSIVKDFFDQELEFENKF